MTTDTGNDQTQTTTATTTTTTDTSNDQSTTQAITTEITDNNAAITLTSTTETTDNNSATTEATDNTASTSTIETTDNIDNNAATTQKNIGVFDMLDLNKNGIAESSSSESLAGQRHIQCLWLSKKNVRGATEHFCYCSHIVTHLLGKRGLIVFNFFNTMLSGAQFRCKVGFSIIHRFVPLWALPFSKPLEFKVLETGGIVKLQVIKYLPRQRWVRIGGRY